MRVVECNEKRPKFEIEDLGNAFLIRLYENEKTVHRDGSDNQPEYNGYQYTTYEIIGTVPDDLNDRESFWASYIKDSDITETSELIRNERDRLLLSCDWAVLPDAKTNKEKWETYRQALRDIPEQKGFPYEVTWPVPPSN